MISQKLNELLTRTGEGSDAGKLMRLYWQPAALQDELHGTRPVVPVNLLGESLVLFRDDEGKLGLIERACPHRGADLCYGRLEDNGLRCAFHGWHFDRNGRCTEQPGEPPGSTMHERVQLRSYPVVEKNGIVFAYLGPGEPPPFADLDCFRAPESHVFAFKGLWRCNWLQALEVGIDPAHASFLHRFLQDEDSSDSYGKQFRDKTGHSDIPMTRLLREFPRPEIRVDETGYGLRLTALRHMPDGNTHVRVTNQIFPSAICIPMSREMNITQWHVPLDDETCYWYSMFTSFGKPVDKTVMREQRLREHRLPDYAPIKHAGNAYGYSADEQNSLTYTGMGLDINVHDQWAVESMGRIQDRTKEHLGKTDIGIVAYRKRLQSAIQSMNKGQLQELPMLGHSENGSTSGRHRVQGPVANDTIAARDRWHSEFISRDAERRAACTDWNAKITNYD